MVVSTGCIEVYRSVRRQSVSIECIEGRIERVCDLFDEALIRPSVSLGTMSLVVRRGNCTCPGSTVNERWRGVKGGVRGVVGGGVRGVLVRVSQEGVVVRRCERGC